MYHMAAATVYHSEEVNYKSENVTISHEDAQLDTYLHCSEYMTFM